MHQHHRHACRGDHLRRLRVPRQRRHVVDQRRARHRSRRCITPDLRVSIDTAVPPAASCWTTGRTRSISSPSHTVVAPGRVDSPPTSMIAAPCRRHRRARLGGRARIGIGAAVGETVGRRVDDPHHLRLVEPDRPRRPAAAARACAVSRAQSAAMRLVEARLDPLDRHQLARHRPRHGSARRSRTSSARPPAARPCRHGRTGESTKPVGRMSVRVTRL